MGPNQAAVTVVLLGLFVLSRVEAGRFTVRVSLRALRLL